MGKAAIAMRPAATFVARLRSTLHDELRSFKQRDIANEMGVSESYISQLLSGRTNPTLRTVEKLLLAADRIRERKVADAE